MGILSTLWMHKDNNRCVNSPSHHFPMHRKKLKITWLLLRMSSHNRSTVFRASFVVFLGTSLASRARYDNRGFAGSYTAHSSYHVCIYEVLSRQSGCAISWMCLVCSSLLDPRFFLTACALFKFTGRFWNAFNRQAISYHFCWLWGLSQTGCLCISWIHFVQVHRKVLKCPIELPGD